MTDGGSHDRLAHIIDTPEDSELVTGYQGEEDPYIKRMIGREIMWRLLADVELPAVVEGRASLHDVAAAALLDPRSPNPEDQAFKDEYGCNLTGPDGGHLQILDYLDVASRHGLALPMTLNYMSLSPDQREVYRPRIRETVQGNLPANLR